MPREIIRVAKLREEGIIGELAPKPLGGVEILSNTHINY